MFLEGDESGGGAGDEDGGGGGGRDAAGVHDRPGGSNGVSGIAVVGCAASGMGARGSVTAAAAQLAAVTALSVDDVTAPLAMTMTALHVSEPSVRAVVPSVPVPVPVLHISASLPPNTAATARPTSRNFITPRFIELFLALSLSLYGWSARRLLRAYIPRMRPIVSFVSHFKSRFRWLGGNRA